MQKQKHYADTKNSISYCKNKQYKSIIYQMSLFLYSIMLYYLIIKKICSL